MTECGQFRTISTIRLRLPKSFGIEMIATMRMFGAKRECAYAHAIRMIDALTLLGFDYVMVYEGPTVYERCVTDIQWW